MRILFTKLSPCYFFEFILCYNIQCHLVYVFYKPSNQGLLWLARIRFNLSISKCYSSSLSFRLLVGKSIMCLLRTFLTCSFSSSDFILPTRYCWMNWSLVLFYRTATWSLASMVSSAWRNVFISFYLLRLSISCICSICFFSVINFSLSMLALFVAYSAFLRFIRTISLSLLISSFFSSMAYFIFWASYIWSLRTSSKLFRLLLFICNISLSKPLTLSLKWSSFFLYSSSYSQTLVYFLYKSIVFFCSISNICLICDFSFSKPSIYFLISSILYCISLFSC